MRWAVLILLITFNCLQMNDIRTARNAESDSLSRNSAAYELLKASSAAAAKKDADGQH